MIQRVLIANRGEIAVRIARACTDLQFECVSMCPRDDAPAAARIPATRSVPLPGSGARAYLDIRAVIEAARAAGCDAVHPGYGFLSENAEFAQSCADAGLVFIGPSPEILHLFGDKAAARALAQRLHVPVLPGTGGAITLEQAQAFFASLAPGRAMMLKAVAGGGGRGMRIVRHADAVPEAFERCRSEALAGFGNGALFAEACIETARHIEVQVVGDGSGAVTWIGERECSLQRRHQKLVEIAPSPSLDPAQREAVAKAAMGIAQAVRYRGLGTFEFLLDTQHGGFVFIEVNPRLQVEHTVTEEVFGIDLVQTQLRLFDGGTLATLGLDAPPAVPPGWAIQFRVNTETMLPDGDARGAAGRLTAYRPAAGPGVRVDGYAQAGDLTHPGFDSLLAKLIVRTSGGDYASLLQRARRALDEFVVAGVPTNLGFLRALVRHPDVIANQVGTRWIDAHAAAIIASIAPEAATEDLADTTMAPPESAAGLRARSLEEPAVDPSLLKVRAPMQGVLVSIEVTEGALVRAGQAVAVLESMKMEHLVGAEQAGRIERILPTRGDVLEAGAAIVVMTPIDSDDLPAAQRVAKDPDAIRPDLAEVLERQAMTLDAHRTDAVAKRHRQGGRTARENIDDLCDAGSFVEYGSLAVAAQRSRRTMDELMRSTPADGVITGVGSVNGATFGETSSACVVIAYDYTVLAGTQGFIGHRKQDRILAVAEQLQRPIVLFAEGGGGRPGDADEDNRVVAGLHVPTFHSFARLSGAVPLVGIVHGRCFAGNAALLGCCDVIIATRASTIGMGGPAMIEGGGLGIVRAEDVGPVSVQGPNGVIDLIVEDEAQAVATARRYLSYFQGRVSEWRCGDQRELRRVIPENRLRAYDIRTVVQGLADLDSVLELRPLYGVGILTALVRIEGRPFGLIANNPSHLGGAIDADGSDKAARFLQLCDAFDLPVLSLCDTPGFMVGPAIEREAMVRRCCRLFVTGANIDVPFFTVVLRKGYGLGAMAMAGGGFYAPLFNVSWPSGEFGGMGLEGAVRLGFRDELAAIDDAAQRDAEFRRRVAEMYARGKALNAASLLEVDNVIDPADTRRWILRGLDSIKPRAGRVTKKRPHVDTW